MSKEILITGGHIVTLDDTLGDVGGDFVKRGGALVGAHAAKARDLMHEVQIRLRVATR
jgi:hypothetical protein